MISLLYRADFVNVFTNEQDLFCDPNQVSLGACYLAGPCSSYVWQLYFKIKFANQDKYVLVPLSAFA